jgi:hypothetical protein
LKFISTTLITALTFAAISWVSIGFFSSAQALAKTGVSSRTPQSMDQDEEESEDPALDETVPSQTKSIAKPQAKQEMIQSLQKVIHSQPSDPQNHDQVWMTPVEHSNDHFQLHWLTRMDTEELQPFAVNAEGTLSVDPYITTQHFFSYLDIYAYFKARYP